jgi:hypothetical protein
MIEITAIAAAKAIFFGMLVGFWSVTKVAAKMLQEC